MPGARVAIQGSWDRENYTEAFVDKVYKSGNFTLRGDGSRQQWRPWLSGWNADVEWRANETGEGWRRGSLVFWDEATDKVIKEGIAATNRRGRWATLRRRLEKLEDSEISDGLLDALEAALAQGIEARRAETRSGSVHESDHE